MDCLDAILERTAALAKTLVAALAAIIFQGNEFQLLQKKKKNQGFRQLKKTKIFKSR